MYYVYMLRCKDDSLYTGWTTDIKRRTKEHNDGVGGKYTRSKRPVKLVYLEETSTKQEAMKREYAIKQFTKTKKENMVVEFQEIFSLL